ncbi:hypothetical protein K505DRAFT_329334 [Melanomma pulvis-pyrius CBS 109.77]|uniref:Uncharacterized protein n=1 Tax=Melanomma pulvis-pyrius CBS 109.77 TaxID=1314802 RepID=A0A6A6WVJ7_9PLEO|nr:hypothetical protein K505DRAFT_329334 [Melanomma pulvis-pyrius CBS 109.77]
MQGRAGQVHGPVHHPSLAVRRARHSFTSHAATPPHRHTTNHYSIDSIDRYVIKRSSPRPLPASTPARQPTKRRWEAPHRIPPIPKYISTLSAKTSLTHTRSHTLAPIPHSHMSVARRGPASAEQPTIEEIEEKK